MPIQISQPNRSTMRLVFQLALSACTLPGAQKEIQDASNYFEYVWITEDKREAEGSSTEQKPKGESAVEKHGIDSPQAQGVRDARRAANIKKKQAAKESPKSEEGEKEAQ